MNDVKVLKIGRKEASFYLWTIFLLAYEFDEIMLQFHDKYAEKVHMLIDGLKHFGWVRVGNLVVSQVTLVDQRTKEKYKLRVNQVVMEKVGAIKGL